MENGKGKNFSFYIITDTHYFENSLGASGPAYERRSLTDQKCIAETGAIIDAGFEILAKDAGIDTIIIPGDLIFNGEKESHRGFIKKLEKLRGSGKKIYVITAKHDFNDSPVGYVGEETVSVEGTKREELYDLYYDFSFSSAIAEDRRSLSYVAQLAPGIRLLALNCDGDGEGDDFNGFDGRQMEWIHAQICDAHESGNYIFAMTHYPILPGSPVMNFINDAKVTNWRETAQTLADWGLDLIFTGHMHMQSVNSMTTENGNVFYDVCTGSFVGCPCSIRKAEFRSGGLEITSSTIDDFDWDKGGKTAKEYFDWRFDRMITDTIDAMAVDVDYFMRKVSLGNNKALRTPIKLVGKILQKLTLGGLGRILFFHVDKSIKPILLKDFGVEIVRNIFVGDEPYTKGTPQYEAVENFLRRLRPVTKRLGKKFGEKTPELSDISGFVLGVIGDGKKIDNNAFLPVKWEERTGNAAVRSQR